MKINISKNIKIALATTIGSISTIAIASPAFAQSVVTCPTGFGSMCNLQANNIGKYVSEAVTIILIAATLIALFFLIWGGIRWITSGGDKAKVDEARKTIIGAIVGLIIAFLAYFILTLVLSIFGITLANFTLPKLG